MSYSKRRSWIARTCSSQYKVSGKPAQTNKNTHYLPQQHIFTGNEDLCHESRQKYTRLFYNIWWMHILRYCITQWNHPFDKSFVIMVAKIVSKLGIELTMWVSDHRFTVSYSPLFVWHISQVRLFDKPPWIDKCKLCGLIVWKKNAIYITLLLGATGAATPWLFGSRWLGMAWAPWIAEASATATIQLFTRNSLRLPQREIKYKIDVTPPVKYAVVPITRTRTILFHLKNM